PYIASPMGMYSVDVVNNDLLGANVTMYQASNLGRRKARKRRAKDPNAPKPARYAWNFFFKEHYKKIRSKGASGVHFDVQKAFTDIGHSLGEKWKALTAAEREPYVELARKDKLRFEEEMREYAKNGSLKREDSANQEAEELSEVKAEETPTTASPRDSNSSPMDKKKRKVSDQEPTGPADKDESTEAAAKKPRTADLAEDGKPETAAASVAATDPAANGSGEDHVNDADIELKRAKADKQQQAEPPKAAKEVAVSDANMTEMTADVLVTDDDETFIVMMSATLRRLHVKQGYQNLNIHVAKNGQEALKKIVDEKQRFAIVTMDKEMNDDLGGVETVKQMRDAGYDGCVLGVTGDEGAAESQFDQVGADATLFKNQQGLFSKVHNILVEKLNDTGTPSSPTSATKPANKTSSTSSSSEAADKAAAAPPATTTSEAEPTKK
ncbi:Non-histone chromosomal protein 6, partial [Durusdinium trenchii]